MILEGLPHLAGVLGIATSHLISLGQSTGQLAVGAVVVNAAMWFLMFGPNTKRNANYLEDESASITLSSKIAHHFAQSRQKPEFDRRRWAKRVHRIDLCVWEVVYAGEAIGIGASAGSAAGLQYWGGAAVFGLLKNVLMLGAFELRERRQTRPRYDTVPANIEPAGNAAVSVVNVASYMPDDRLAQIRALVANDGKFVSLPGGR